jgi:hypothetical protein
MAAQLVDVGLHRGDAFDVDLDGVFQLRETFEAGGERLFQPCEICAGYSGGRSAWLLGHRADRHLTRRTRLVN